MPENVATVDQPQILEQQQQAAVDNVNQQIAESLWNNVPNAYQSSEQPDQNAANTDQPKPNEVATPDIDSQELLGEDEYFQKNFGLSLNDFKSKWETFNKPQEAVQPQEVKWTYDESKEDEIYNYIHQKRELDRLEKYDIADANQAAEILRANLQYKYKGTLSSQEIDRLFSKQYSLPTKPIQSLEQTDEDYALATQAWEQQVSEKQMDMIIEAKMTKPELSKLKSQIVQPEIQKPQLQQQGPTQEELAAAEAGRKAYLGALESGYQNFKGYSVVAKDGEVQLPINYTVTPEELTASKQTLENFNINDFFGSRWFDESGNPKVTVMQEDLYDLVNRDKIHQKIANEAAAQMKAYLIKNQNNINLNSVNQNMGPTANQAPPKTESQSLAENIWKL
jgi:hypothetical protein